jgi:hypothetical protein
MQILCTYTDDSGPRAVAYVTVPDAPELRLLFDVPSDAATTDDVVLVDEHLTTAAEAQAVAVGWAAEHALNGTHVQLAKSRDRRIGPPRELARYGIPAGERVLVGLRVVGEVCVSDIPVDLTAP